MQPAIEGLFALFGVHLESELDFIRANVGAALLARACMALIAQAKPADGSQ